MPFVYRYKDMLSERYKYIGIVKADGVPSLEARIKQHENDDWFTTSKWYIDYMTTANVAEAEAIESHLISLYHAEFNKAKANWGTCSFIDIDDTLFVPFATIDPREKYQNQINKLKARIEILKLLEEEQKGVIDQPIKENGFVLFRKGLCHNLYYNPISKEMKVVFISSRFDGNDLKNTKT